jgi:hypothetical protein
MLYPPYNETFGKGVYDEVLSMGFGTLGDGGVHKYFSQFLRPPLLPLLQLLPLLHGYARHSSSQAIYSHSTSQPIVGSPFAGRKLHRRIICIRLCSKLLPARHG